MGGRGAPLVLIIRKQTDECERTLAQGSLGLHPAAKWLSLALRRPQSCLATPPEPHDANTVVKAAVWLFVGKVLAACFCFLFLSSDSVLPCLVFSPRRYKTSLDKFRFFPPAEQSRIS